MREDSGRPAGRIARAVRRAALVALVALAPQRPAAAETAPTVDQLVGFFDSVALQDDTSMFGSAGTVPKPVSRWEQPIRVHLSGWETTVVRDRLAWHLERFQLLAGVDLEIVARREDANLRVSLLPVEEVTARAGSADALCLTQYEPPSGAIEHAEIYLPLGHAVWLDNCMAHELMHAIGFYAHPKDNGNRSVLEQGAPPRLRTFTALDVAGIRMLYDARLRVGLERERALPIARAIARDLVARWPEDARLPHPGEALGPDGFALPQTSAAAAAGTPARASD